MAALGSLTRKIRHEKRVINKSIHLAIGVHEDGLKEALGLRLAETEGAKFWLGVFTELKTRGLRDILIACVDGLKGLAERLPAHPCAGLHRAPGAARPQLRQLQAAHPKPVR